MEETTKKDISFDLDLDTLVSPTKKIRYNGEIIEVNVPDLGQLLKLSKVGGELQGFNAQETTEEQLAEALDKLRHAISELVPNLAVKELNLNQLLALLTFVTKMAVPSDVSELEKRGITLNDDQKKILSAL